MEIRPILSALLRNKTGALLVALQVALSLAILANALYVVNVRQAAAARPSGVADESSVFYLSAHPLAMLSHHAQLAQQNRDLAALRAVGGVLDVARTNQMPMSRSGRYNSIYTDRKQLQPSADVSVYTSPDALLKTLGLTLLEGRDFSPGDILEVDPETSNAFPRTIIVSKALADAAFPGAVSAIGKTLFDGDGSDAKEARIVGVVERLQGSSAQLGNQGEYSIILPVLASERRTLYAIRVEAGQRERVMREAETALRKAAPAPLVIQTRAVEEDRQARYRNDRALAWMLIAVSVLLLLITASGIVGIASLWVAQRGRQIGVRRALGARRSDILRYFITENILITSAGVAAGALLAMALNQLLVSRLELGRLPLSYLLAGALAFWVLGIAAVYGPAWRAAAISPAAAAGGA